MIYVLSILNAPKYEKVAVGCFGINDWSDAVPYYKDSLLFEKTTHDKSYYILEYFTSRNFNDIEAIIVIFTFGGNVIDRIKDHVHKSIPLIHLNCFDVEKSTYHGLTESGFQNIASQLPTSNYSFTIATLLTAFTTKALEDTKAKYIKTLVEQNNKKYKLDEAGQERSKFLTEIETQFCFTFPALIKSFFVQFDFRNSEFWSAMKKLPQNNSRSCFTVQINSRFARKIVEFYQQLEEQEIQNLIKELESFENPTEFSHNILEYLLIDGPNNYDYQANTFKISLLQKAYKSIGLDTNNIKVLLTIWAHCGGWGGLIIRGYNAAYHGGGMHGHYLEVSVNGKLYEYNSNFYEQMEEHFLYNSKEMLLQNLKDM